MFESSWAYVTTMKPTILDVRFIVGSPNIKYGWNMSNNMPYLAFYRSSFTTSNM
jgi:hypothetical protein